jgi:hypothetical protein
MEHKSTKRTRKSSAKAKQKAVESAVMSERELAKLGGGEIAYIRTMTSAEAKRMFPAIKGLPRGINLYTLHAADGTPLALTDTRQAAIGHAIGDALEIASLH